MFFQNIINLINYIIFMVLKLLTKEDKEEINEEVVSKINIILKNHNCPFEMDKLSILNLGGVVTFLGNFRVHNEDELDIINEEVNEILSKYDNVVYKAQRVRPCCELPYTSISFNFKLDNN